VTRTHERTAAALLATFLIGTTTGCAHPIGAGGYGNGTGTADTAGVGAGFGPPTATGRRSTPKNGPYSVVYMEARIIVSKTAPVTLYAEDGDWCEVTEARFRELKVGDRVTCAWHLVAPD
jgi:hypothetical protein